MKKNLLLIIFTFFVAFSYAQTQKAWKEVTAQNIKLNKNVQRESFPQDFKLIQLDFAVLQQVLMNTPGRFSKSKKGTVITLPNVSGGFERFEMFEASNFDAELQARFPQIRAFVGKGIDDKNALLRLSISPSGIQTMVFRANRRSEFMEPYSEDGKIYVVYNSSSTKGKLPFTCSTTDINLANELTSKVGQTAFSSSGSLLTFRLALSCNGEYSNYFGATSSAQVANVLTAFNNTMTRVNGVFEKDFGIHMNIVNQTTNVIYYVPATDPYTTMANWNTQLQRALNTTLTGVSTSLAANNAAYDVGHMFGASGGGGNAGCIGCVCVDGVTAGTGSTKGRGITSPADGIPSGDNFDIDYVAHELGHQFGANHTFSNSNEGAGVNKEVGSGVTIMGYAGITSYDTHLHSIDVFHSASIAQVQANMAGKTCPTVTSLTHGAPIVNAGLDYIIPKSTPFILTGSAIDSNGDVMNYVWEQNDDGVGQTNANSAARIAKPTGSNWVNYLPSTTPSRYFPNIASVVANSPTTSGLDVTSEALSSVARTLNFRLTARDNNILGGQTGFDDTVITVNATAGPFAVTAPNTSVSWVVGTNQTVTWDVAGTTANGVNTDFVDIYLSNDGGYTYPILLASRVPNDGSEVILVPNNIGTTKRIMVKGNNHVFFDISNSNFTITAAPSTFGIAFNGIEGEQNKDACQGSVVSYSFPYMTYGGFSASTAFSVTGQPVGSTVVFTPTNTATDGTITMEISNTAASATGLYTMIVTGSSGGTTKTISFYLNLISGNFGTQTLTSPADLAVGQSTSTNLTWPSNASASLYDVQVATDAGFTSIVSSATVATNSYTVSGLAEGTDYFWRVLPKNSGCMGVFSSAYKFTTGTTTCGNVYSNNTSLSVPDGVGSPADGTEVTKSIVVPGTLTGNLNNVTVDLAFSHSYIDDLRIWLTHPDGTVVSLWNHNCESEFSSISVTYADGNPSIPLEPVCSASTGTFAPESPLSALNGKLASGTWVLHALDYWTGDTGIIGNWSINLCVATPLVSESFNTIEDLAIYPNPNNGNFTVQFNSSSNNDVKIGVHDVRGRQIFDKTYQNNGLFNQSLNLDNVQSGIYLVTVQDGLSKTTKKIVVE